ncbi:hypothetical protein BH20ACI4_BH20ACI4_23030 [soil metagenome]
MLLFEIANSTSSSLSESLGLLLFGVFLIALTVGIRRVFKLEK